MIGLNLLPDVKKEFISAQRTRNFVISLSILGMIIAAGLTVFLALFVYVGQETAINLEKDAISKNQAELSAKPEIEKYLTIQNQLSSLGALHDKDHKSIYSRLFSYLIKLNPAAPNSVSLGSIKVSSEEKAISLQGSTADYRGLNVFENTLKKANFTYRIGEEKYETPLFTTVDLTSASLSNINESTIVSFEIQLTYTPEACQPNLENPELVIPQITISDSLDNAPSISPNKQEDSDGQAD